VLVFVTLHFAMYTNTRVFGGLTHQPRESAGALVWGISRVGSGKGRVRVRFGPNPNPAYSLPRAISRFAQKHVCVDFIYQRIEPRQKGAISLQRNERFLQGEETDKQVWEYE